MANKNILLGQYTETNSVFHRLDPRTKLLSLMVSMLSFLMLDSAVSYAVAAIFVMSMVIMSKIPLRLFGTALRPILLILLFTFVYHLMTTKGTLLWSWSFVHITVEGFQSGTRLVLRLLLLVLLASLLTFTTKPLSMAQGLEKLLAPLSKLRLPVEQFSLMIVIAIRFIPTIVQEVDRIILAQKARGYDIAALRWPKRLFAYIPLLIPLIFTTIQRAEQLTLAIEARAYGDGKGRTVFKELKFGHLDYAVGGLSLIFPAILLLLQSSGQ